MLVRGAFNHLLRPGLRRDFRDSYQQYPEEYPMFLKTGNQDRAHVEAVNLAGLGRMVQRGESEPVTYMDPVQGEKVEFVDDEYALGFIVSKRMVEDDLYGKANQNSKWLGRSARLTQEYQAASLLDDAFDGNIFTGVNGEELIATDHELLNSAGTGSNQLATDAQLGVTGLQAAFDLAASTVDENGDPIVIKPSRLVVSIADEWVAIQLAKSQQEPFTADNQVNALRDKSFRHVVSHYKTQNNDWFFQDTDLMDAHFLFRVRPEFDDTFDFDTKAAKFSARQRVNVYFFDWRGIIGSNPT